MTEEIEEIAIVVIEIEIGIETEMSTSRIVSVTAKKAVTEVAIAKTRKRTCSARAEDTALKVAIAADALVLLGTTGEEEATLGTATIPLMIAAIVAAEETASTDDVTGIATTIETEEDVMIVVTEIAMIAEDVEERTTATTEDTAVAALSIADARAAIEVKIETEMIQDVDVMIAKKSLITLMSMTRLSPKRRNISMSRWRKERTTSTTATTSRTKIVQLKIKQRPAKI